MSKDELISKVKEFSDIANTLAERYQQICFEKLLNDYLQADSKTSTNSGTKSGGGSSGKIGEYSNVIVIEDEEVKVLTDLPGNNLKEKSVNAALLVLIAKFYSGQTDVVTSEIRKLCKEHAALDKKNFASHLRGARQLFLLSGKKKGLTAKLTEPGKRKAVQLLSEMASTALQ